MIRIFWHERVMPMDKRLIFCAGSTAAAQYAQAQLQTFGLETTTEASAYVTDLLLDVPSFGPEGQLRGGGSVKKLLEEIPKKVTIFGGNLTHPALAGYTTVDLLQDEHYLAENAYITAECALDVALPYLPITLRGCPTLILGWGRIGKCLGKLLAALGADVTIAARKTTDRAMLHALGYRAVDMAGAADGLGYFRLIFNTVPEPILNQAQMDGCHPGCVKIELASKPGMFDADVITARGLPGVHMPESSGRLIAQTVFRLYQGGIA